ncbi:hypothetical protein M1D30_04470 [Prevotella sp. E15-22]|uniref:hypothetical protein n=1 Tax=Prevotella sp. E15-22 TaxID=2937774 RepID=UPI00205299F0|nr:hypothetical protein [Prevotella sp. E15-22]UPS45434.1 hypothetical protein M1D30_04470 [Prevotella sp. E15-22]
MTTRDAYCVLESANFLRDLGEVQPVTPEDMETRRRIIDFVRELETARFMLAMSYKHPYLDIVEEKDFGNKFKTEYFKQHYLYSALIWYHNSFDMVLQCLWFNHQLYAPTELTGQNMEEILRRCKISQIKKLLYQNKDDNPISNFEKRHKEVLDLANRLKHRQYLENSSYILYEEFFNVVKGKYNSDETKKHVDLNKIQDLLIVFHKDIIQMAKELLVPIHDTLSNQFGQS